jgi:hypothetical protein
MREMKVQKAKKGFLDTKQDLSPRTLEQYSQTLDCLERQGERGRKDEKTNQSRASEVNASPNTERIKTAFLVRTLDFPVEPCLGENE